MEYRMSKVSKMGLKSLFRGLQRDQISCIEIINNQRTEGLSIRLY